ncbi:MAG: aminodeoxychorismate/anthranilate synthase component II [Actinobacteria bacterium]|nr:aminodeoxychorismate/anthranilate synthase component II [Actinomycetota bacterium]
MALKLLLIDNYDSFVYNLAQAFGGLGAEPVVIRNDATLDRLEPVAFDAVVISPGPGTPDDTGISRSVIDLFASRGVPVLGVCLGHQCIGSLFGGRIERAPVGPVHGKTSKILHQSEGVFAGLPSPFIATRYHSLAMDAGSVPRDLRVTARSDDDVIMGVKHRSLPIEGVQFHPESVLTDEGPRLLKNFLAWASELSPQKR